MFVLMSSFHLLEDFPNFFFSILSQIYIFLLVNGWKIFFEENFSVCGQRNRRNNLTRCLWEDKTKSWGRPGFRKDPGPLSGSDGKEEWVGTDQKMWWEGVEVLPRPLFSQCNSDLLEVCSFSWCWFDVFTSNWMGDNKLICMKWMRLPHFLFNFGMAL